MKEYKPLRVIISGGGTGGHIFPALSIAGMLRKRCPQTEILFVGAEGRMEMDRVPAAGYEITGLPVAGFDRRRLWRNFGVLLKLWRSMRKARRVVRDFHPDIAVGVGGYASGPVLKQAQKAGIPTVLQEQNSYAGVTNKLLARKAKAICVAYDGMDRFFPSETIHLTGNPVRDGLDAYPGTQADAKRQLGFDPDRQLLFVTGGSLGARTINESVIAALPALKQAGIQVLWQTGKFYERECRDHLTDSDTMVQATAFISDMSCAYRAADLVVARAGAGTISELQNLGKAAILIPSPNVAEDHQRKNAMALVHADAAVMIPDDEARERLAPTVIQLMSDPQQMKSLGDNAYAMRHPDSAAEIIDIIYNTLNNA